MDLLRYYNLIAYVSAFSVLIPLSISALKRKSANRVNAVLFFYLLLSLAAELINFVLLINHLPNILAGEYFKVLELFLIVYIFQLMHQKSLTVRLILIGLLCTAVILFVIDLSHHTTVLFNGFSHCTVMALCFVAFYNMLHSEKDIRDYYYFWIVTGFLFYFSVSFFLFLLNDVTNFLSAPLAKNLWLINLIANVLYYMFLSLGIWKIKIK